MNKKHSEDIVDLIVEDYSQTLRSLNDERQEVCSSLKQLCSAVVFQEKIDELLQRKDSLSDKVNHRKYKKLHNAIDSASSLTGHWLPELGLTDVEKDYLLNGEDLCDNLINAAMKLLNRDIPHVSFQSSTLHGNMLEYCPFETIHVHHNGQGHFCTSSSIGGVVTLYDSLKQPPTSELLTQITSLYSPDPSIVPQINITRIECKQKGVNDCGLFALAYAVDIAEGRNPAKFKYDQEKFRDHLFNCFMAHKLMPFPKIAEHVSTPPPYEHTEHVPLTSKWSVPKHTTKKIFSGKSGGIPIKNCYVTLQDIDTEGTGTNRTPTKKSLQSM